MRTYIRIYDKRTGDLEDIDFPNADEAFDAYWTLTEQMDNNPDIKFELITDSNEKEWRMRLKEEVRGAGRVA
jgi:hypothetical protein